MPASATSRILAAAAVMLGLGACTTVLSLDPYQGASDSVCGVLDGCYKDGAFKTSCRAHINDTLGAAGVKDGTDWLTALSDLGCLDTCSSARTCLDRSPICVTHACAAREECCGFTEGRTDCEAGGCCFTRGQTCADDDQCCFSAGSCIDGHCGGVVCREPGVACSLDEQCCSQHCNRADKTCTAVICGEDGYDCKTSEDCCGRFCDPSGRCSPQACSQLGQGCSDKSDCCDETNLCFKLGGVGFCSGASCLPDEAECSADADCCPGSHCDPVFVRCSASCGAEGAPCAVGGDCCSGSCDAAHGTCAAGCSSGDCDVDSDCCSGMCIQSTCSQGCQLVTCANHSVCDVGDALPDVGCPIPDACVAEVCSIDPHCCCEGWDSLCVYEARHPAMSKSACLNACP
jgi:hypothetical protein